MKMAVCALMMSLFLSGISRADIVVSEVSAWGSGNTPYAADWFELTNTGNAAVDITGWRFDDDSNDFSLGATLTGVSSIAAGQSVVFIQAASGTSFVNSWFGGTAPAGFTLGTYSGTGLGLSTAGDAVNIFNAAGVRQTNVAFGASPAAPNLATFDNAQGLANTTISQLSVVGVNGAFTAVNSNAGTTQIGSPGSIAAIPEPGSLALISLIAGFAFVRRRAR